MIMFPLSIGLAAVAPTVVETFFDPKWSNVKVMLMCALRAVGRAPRGQHLYLVLLRFAPAKLPCSGSRGRAWPACWRRSPC